MLFNSDVFLKFLAAFVLLYYMVRGSLRGRNLLIVAASYLFYGWWDWRFLGLLIVSSLMDYWVGLALQSESSPRRRRLWLACSLAGNLGTLCFFKYFHFFVESFATLLGQMGLRPSLPSLEIVLPVGISFYTFQTMSYALDVYRRQVGATRDLVAFLAYVSFFPQLVAGPIERASHLLPQFLRARVITREMLRSGVWLIVWGMFQKVVLADNLAPLVELVYQSPTDSALLVVLGTIAFGLQIYCDFAGYSDIARGLAHVLGFELMVNFNLPYLATNVRDFWRRWHISLSTWLRDYLYIPLGGSRCGEPRAAFNLVLTMLVGGLWHGAAWHFVLWGLWHGLGLLLCRTWSSLKPQLPRFLPPALSRPLAWLTTMVFVFCGWALFRAESTNQWIGMAASLGNWACPSWTGTYAIGLALLTAPPALMHLWQAVSKDLLAPLRLPGWTLAGLEAVLLAAIAVFWGRDATPFIYFQF